VIDNFVDSAGQLLKATAKTSATNFPARHISRTNQRSIYLLRALVISDNCNPAILLHQNITRLKNACSFATTEEATCKNHVHLCVSKMEYKTFRGEIPSGR